MALFNCTPTSPLKIKGVQGIIVTVDGDTISIGIDPETFPEDLTGGGDTTKLEQRVADLERDCADNSSFVEGMKALAENPENEGKYFGVKDEIVDILDAPTGGANIIKADSVEELPDPTTVPEDTIALVPSDSD